MKDCLNCGDPLPVGSHFNTKHCSRPCRYNYFYQSKRVSRPEKIMLDGARGRARKFGLKCTIKESDISIPTHCPVLGIELGLLNTKQGRNSPSLDKINPDGGYTPNNIRVISQRANILKSNATFKEVEALYNDFKEREGFLER